jgi:crotonobetainyl-CoA:carnitine CoA-transferase CaiB-like acyl-CoA transferase
MAPHGCYRCSGTDRYCVIAVEDDEQWHALCGVVGPTIADDARFATFVGRQHHRTELNAAIASWTESRDAVEVMEVLQRAGVPAGVVQSGADLAADEHLEARGFLETVSHPILGEITMAGLPIHFSLGGAESYKSPPPLGSDNEYLITGLLGHDADELAKFQEQEIVY